MSAVMKLKTLQGHLESLNGFAEPKIQYEQYETPAHLAATAIYTIQTQFESIENCNVLDAGCGPGIWSIGAALLGASVVTAVDIDEDALEVFKENVKEMEMTNIDAIQCDFLDPRVCRWEGYFDTVLMNPPFGTKNNVGIDMKFLRMGTLLSNDSVYSLHKSSTRMLFKKVKTINANKEEMSICPSGWEISLNQNKENLSNEDNIPIEKTLPNDDENVAQKKKRNLAKEDNGSCDGIAANPNIETDIFIQ